MADNNYQFGLSKAYYATFTYDDVTMEYTYETPKRITCAISLSLSPAGDSNNLYCDNAIGFTSVSNQGYEGSLEGSLISTDFKKDVLMEQEDNNGMVVEFANVQPKPFALLYEVEGDANQTRFVFYNCTASRPEQNANTNTESIEPDTQTLEFTSAPRKNDSIVKAYATTTATNFDAFYTAVQEPDFSVVTP